MYASLCSGEKYMTLTIKLRFLCSLAAYKNIFVHVYEWLHNDSYTVTRGDVNLYYAGKGGPWNLLYED